MNLDDVVLAWDRADPIYIHPTREHESEDAYWASGRDIADALVDWLPPQGTVVDFGCGDGRVTIPLHERGVNVIGVDSSPTMLGALARRAPQIPSFRSDGTDLRARLGGQVDAVFALSVLIHHDYEDGEMLVNSLADAVVSGGQVALDWPVADNPGERRRWIEVTTWPRERRDDIATRAGLRPDGGKIDKLTLYRKV